jgi:hypothetical protein
MAHITAKLLQEELPLGAGESTNENKADARKNREMKMNCTRSLPLFALPPDECRKSDCLGECEGGVVDGRERSGMVAGVAKGGVERWGLPDPDPENGMARPNGEGGVNFAPYTLRRETFCICGNGVNFS